MATSASELTTVAMKHDSSSGRLALGYVKPSTTRFHYNQTVARLLGLARALEDPNGRPTTLAAAEERVCLYRQALSLIGDARQRTRPVCLSLCQALGDRWFFSGKLDDVEEQIRIYRAIVKTCPEGTSGYYLHVLRGLGVALRCRFERSDAVSDLEEAFALHHQAAEHHGLDDPDRHLSIGELSSSYRARFDRLGNDADLSAAIQLGRETLLLRGPGHPHRDKALAVLGFALWRRYTRRGNKADLSEAIAINQEALSLRPDGHPERDVSLSTLGICNRYLFDLTGDLKYLSEAAQNHQDAFALRPVGHRVRYCSLINLSLVYQMDFTLAGDVSHLNIAIAHSQEAVDLCHKGHLYHGWALDSLVNALVYRFRLRGQISDLESAILHARMVLDARPPGNPHRDWSLDSLGGVLVERFAHSGDVEDIMEATMLYREALQLRRPGHRFHSQGLSNLSQALILRHEQVSSAADLDEAIQLQEQWLQLAHLAESQRGVRLKRLAHALHLRFRFQRTSVLDDIDRSIQLYEEALRIQGAGSHDRHDTLGSLARSYETRFMTLKSVDDLHSAMKLQTEALSSLPLGHVHRSRCQARLSCLHLIQSTPYFSFKKAMRYFGFAISDEHRNARLRLSDAVEILDTAELCFSQGNFDGYMRSQLLHAYRQAIELLPRVAYFGLEARSRLLVLSNTENLGAKAAFHALKLLQPDVAVEMLEEGRNVFWRQCIRLRTPFDDLPPELCTKMVNASRELEMGHVRTTALSPHLGHKSKAVLEAELARRRRLGEEFEQLISQARTIPGFNHFMSRSSFRELAVAAARGPVLFLLSSSPICQAILLPSPEANALQIPLLELTPSRVRSLQHTLRTSSRLIRGQTQEGRGMKRREVDTFGAQQVLAELWDKVVRVVLDALGWSAAEGRQRPRLWICSTGAFTDLPVHAAGLYTVSAPVCCSDYFVSSYTPTIDLLLHVRRNIQPMVRNRTKILLAAVSHPFNFKWSQLPCTAEEAKSVAEVLPSQMIIQLPQRVTPGPHSGAAPCATAQDVLSNLAQASILHLACHGHQDASNALASGFVMHDEMLTLAQVMSLNLPNAFLAFLSACATAKGDEAQPDQAVHLAAAMLFAGFRSVIGTMWSMGDVDGPIIARKVYEELFGGDSEHLDPNDVPYALDAAVALLRKRGMPPSLWATYIHIGL